jgi:hypothetical protein
MTIPINITKALSSHPARYSVAVAIAGSALKRHTPNFGWCGIFPSLDKLLETSHHDLFVNFLGSALRPSLHLEKALGHACGMTCVNTYYYLVYFAALLISLSLTTPNLFRLAENGTPRQRGYALRILWALPIYLIIFSYGSIVDAVFPMSVIGLSSLMLREPDSAKSNRSFPSKAISQIALFGTFVFLADMTRPYAPYVILLLLAAATAQRYIHAIIGIILGLLLAMPYHAIQYRNIGSLILTNYTGCNLIEVFKAPGIVPAGSMTTTPQKVIAKTCSDNAQKVSRYVQTQPISALGDFLSPIRLARTIWPAPFTPWEYSIAPGFKTVEEVAQWALWAALIIFLYIPITRLSWSSLPEMFGRGPSRAMLSCAILLPLAFTAIAHGGQEAGRVGMAFILPIVFYTSSLYSLKCQRKESSGTTEHQTC